MEDDKKEFLRALGKLSKRYNIYIGACGCCGSPYLDRKDGSAVGHSLTWNSKSETYTEGE